MRLTLELIMAAPERVAKEAADKTDGKHSNYDDQADGMAGPETSANLALGYDGHRVAIVIRWRNGLIERAATETAGSRETGENCYLQIVAKSLDSLKSLSFT